MLRECRLNCLLPLQPFAAAGTAGLANCDLGQLTSFCFSIGFAFQSPSIPRFVQAD